ncbi:MAG TPA: sodium:calcium antiporter [archaeon]|nr:sodium:calcium antiporter [archaeon]
MSALFFPLLIILVGMVVLLKSSEFTVVRVLRLAKHFDMPEYVTSFIAVGVIAILPELSIGINSALSGESNFGLGIVFGSNVADLTLIIGLVALLAPKITLHSEVIKKIWLLIGVVFLPIILLLDGEISRIDGIILLAGFFVYVFSITRTEHVHHFEDKKDPLFLDAIVLLFALAIMFVSGHFITEAAHDLSVGLALPIFFVGVILAIGTCMPELMFALQAAKRKHSELGFGDILGNVFADCTLTIGIIALIAPIKVENSVLVLSSGTSMIIALFILSLMFLHKKSIGKKHGLVLIALYIIFLIVQFSIENGNIFR